MKASIQRRIVLGSVALVSGTAVAASLTAAWPAGATPGSGATTSIVAQGTTTDQVHVEANGSTAMVYQRVTLQPGGFTGWHYHPGPLLVVVQSGTLTHFDERCDSRTYTAGQAFEELPGAEHVHMGENVGDVPVVLDVTYVVPAGGPLRVDATAPACTSAA